jgi:phosphate transport system permease protein
LSAGWWRKGKEVFMARFFLLNGLVAIVILLAIFSLLIIQALPALRQIGLGEFFLKLRWNPTSYDKPSYGLLSQIVSSLMVTFGALVLAIPLGIASAAYIAEIASPRLREIIKPVVEILAGIPSVVIGFLGIVLVGPSLARLFHLPNGLNALNGSLLLAVMVLPTIISLSEDAIKAVPKMYKEASLALGANRWQTLWRVIIPSAFSGIIASIMLGLGRAIGETMTVLMACGNAAALPHSFLDPVRTMTATIAIELGEVPYGTLHYHALFVVGLILFMITFIVNLVAEFILSRYQENRE